LSACIFGSNLKKKLLETTQSYCALSITLNRVLGVEAPLSFFTGSNLNLKLLETVQSYCALSITLNRALGVEASLSFFTGSNP
jgi:hypothetical protein